MTAGMRGSRVVVTGGAGFIGSHLVERLVDLEPQRIVVIDDLSTGSTSNLERVAKRIDLKVGDVCDPEVALHAAEADFVFHLAVRNVRASISRPAENLRVNSNGVLEVLEAMRHGSRGHFVYVSSSEVYGIPPTARYDEDVLPRPTTVYGASKLAGEHITMAYRHSYGMDTSVVRPFNNYGPRSHFEGDSGEVIPKFILRALAGLPLVVHGSGDQSRDFMYVSDTAYWLPVLAECQALVGEVVNIGSGQDLTVNELAAMVISMTGSSSSIVHGAERPGDLPKLQADITKASRVVQFELSTSLEEGVQATIDFFASQNVDTLLAREREHNWL